MRAGGRAIPLAELNGLLPGRMVGRGAAGPGRGPPEGADGAEGEAGAEGADGAGADGAGVALAAGASGSAAGGAGGAGGAGDGATGAAAAGAGAAGAADGAAGAGTGALGTFEVPDALGTTLAFGAVGALGAPAGLGADGFFDFAGAPAGKTSCKRRTTGASMVEDAERTNSPISWSFARTTLLSTPNSLASS